MINKKLDRKSGGRAQVFGSGKCPLAFVSSCVHVGAFGATRKVGSGAFEFYIHVIIFEFLQVLADGYCRTKR